MTNLLSTGFSPLVAFLAGFASFASPCVLCMVPVYLSVLGDGAGDVRASRNLLVHRTLLFIGGFTLLFSLLGAGSGLIGSQLASNMRGLEIASGTLMIVLGAAQIWGVEFRLPNRLLNTGAGNKPARAHGLGSLVSGMAVGIAWTPCIGPVLAAILAMASSEGSPFKATLLLFFYSAGIGLPMMMFAFGATRLSRFKNLLIDNANPIRIVSGIVMLIAGFLIASGLFAIFTSQLANLLTPAL